MFTAIRWQQLDTLKELLDAIDYLPAGIKVQEHSFLSDAVRENHIEVAKLLLRRGVKVDSKNTSGKTVLHFAVELLHIEIVELLLENEAAVNATDHSGKTPLLYALKNAGTFCDLEIPATKIINLLLSYGADVNACDNNSMTPLNLAIKYSSETVQKLIQHCTNINFVKSGHNTNSIESGYTALHYAVRYNNGEQDIVEMLLGKGADVNICAQNGETALHIAMHKGYHEVAKNLINHGANIHAVYDSGSLAGYTPLHVAFCSRKYDYGSMAENRKTVIEILLNKGANINANSKNNTTPLHLAVNNNYSDEAKLLLEHGANPNANDDGKSVLCVAVEEGCSKIVEHLLKSCITVKNERDSHMLRVAMLDHKTFSKGVVEMLLTYGFSVAEEVHNGDMFYAALQKRSKSVIVELLKNGFIVNKQYTLRDGKSFIPLHEAVRQSFESAARLLISYGADVNAEDESGATAISYISFDYKKCYEMLQVLLENQTNTKNNPRIWMYAVESNRINIVELLLDRGFDVDWRDSEGCTAMHHAILGGFYYLSPDLGLVKLLLSRGADVNAKTFSNVSVLHLGVLLDIDKVEVFKTLLDYNPDVNVDCDGVTPLLLCAFRGNAVFCQLLVSKGAEVNANLKNKKTSLHVAVSKYPCPVAFKNFSDAMLGSNLLKQYHNAVFGRKSIAGFRSEEGFQNPVERIDDVAVIDALIDCGAEINSKDDDGKTALHYAAENPLTEPLAALIKRGADIMARDNFSKTPLHYAGLTDKTFLKKFRALVSCGADINSRDIDGCTVLHKSAQIGGRSIPTFLNLGCDINALNNDNLTPFEVALITERICSSAEYKRGSQIPIDTYSLRNFVIPSLSKHVTKLKAAKRYVHSNNLVALASRDTGDFYNGCKRELTAMKTKKVGGSGLSYYDIMKKSRNKVVWLAKQVDLEKTLEEDKFDEEFPIYANDFKLILVYLKQVARRSKLLELSMEFFRTCIASVPVECVELIFGYLSDIDLVNLIRVYYPKFSFPGGMNLFRDSEDDHNDYQYQDNYFDFDSDSDLDSGDYYYNYNPGSDSDFSSDFDQGDW